MLLPDINFQNSEKVHFSLSVLAAFYGEADFQRSFLYHSRSASSTGFLESVSWGQGRLKTLALTWQGRPDDCSRADT